MHYSWHNPLVEAYEHRRRCTEMEQLHQKQHYDKQVHIILQEVGIQVWVHQSGISTSSLLKQSTSPINRVPYLVVKHLSDVNYQIHHPEYSRSVY